MEFLIISQFPIIWEELSAAGHLDFPQASTASRPHVVLLESSTSPMPRISVRNEHPASSAFWRSHRSSWTTSLASAPEPGFPVVFDDLLVTCDLEYFIGNLDVTAAKFRHPQKTKPATKSKDTAKTAVWHKAVELAMAPGLTVMQDARGPANGTDYEGIPDTYLNIEQNWNPSDVIEIKFDIRIEANEAPDNHGANLTLLLLDVSAAVEILIHFNSWIFFTRKTNHHSRNARNRLVRRNVC